MRSDELEAFSFTHVTYVRGDRVGELMALLTLTPIFVVVSQATLLVYRRDSSTIVNAMGQFVSLGVNFVLKRLTNQPRPDKAGDLTDSGMPSNHSQFVCFFVAVSVHRLMDRRSPLPLVFRVLYSAALIVLALLVCVSRLYLLYHTKEQVLAGALVGAVLGIAWARISPAVADTLFETPALNALFRFLLVRDYRDVVFPPVAEHAAMLAAADARKSR